MGIGSERTRLVAAYLEALDAKALLIHACPGGQPAKLSFDDDRKLDLTGAFWFSKQQHAELVLMRARGDLEAIGALRPQGWVDLPAREVSDAVVNAAAQLGASWRSAKRVQADAEAEVDRILIHVEEQRKSGGLAQVNTAYKVYRNRQLEAGQKAVPYSAHLFDFKCSLVTLAARNSVAQ